MSNARCTACPAGKTSYEGTTEAGDCYTKGIVGYLVKNAQPYTSGVQQVVSRVVSNLVGDTLRFAGGLFRATLETFELEYKDFFKKAWREEFESNFGFAFPEFDKFEEWLMENSKGPTGAGSEDEDEDGMPTCPYGGVDGPEMLLEYMQTLHDYKTLNRPATSKKEKRKAYMYVQKFVSSFGVLSLLFLILIWGGVGDETRGLCACARVGRWS